jgi:hypothetical protein
MQTHVDRPPIFGSSGRGQPKTPPVRFTVQSGGNGFEVIDHDGRPMIEAIDNAEACEIAETLNAAAFQGTGTLIGAIQSL